MPYIPGTRNRNAKVYRDTFDGGDAVGGNGF